MDRTPAPLLAMPTPASVIVHARAYDRRHSNRRASFRLVQHLGGDAHSGWHLRRDWFGVRDERLCCEQAVWQDRLVRVQTEAPSLGERASAQLDPHARRPGSYVLALSSHRTQQADRIRESTPPHPVVTLGTLPLALAQHWPALLAGDTVRLSYLVLKVQASAVVRASISARSAERTEVTVTPANPVLRAIFGSTVLGFAGSAPQLIDIDGLLDPRDLKRNGRWHEYLGRIEFDDALDLRCVQPLRSHP